MLTVPSPHAFGKPPLQLTVETSTKAQAWSLYSLHKTAPPGFETGWALLDDLPLNDQGRVEALCVDSDHVFPAVVNDELCVVIEQEFQAADCGDDWPESSLQVVERLRRTLLLRLERLLPLKFARCGIVTDPTITFCGRPTLLVSVDARSATPEKVRNLVAEVRAFAYPGSNCSPGRTH